MLVNFYDSKLLNQQFIVEMDRKQNKILLFKIDFHSQTFNSLDSVDFYYDEVYEAGGAYYLSADPSNDNHFILHNVGNFCVGQIKDDKIVLGDLNQYSWFTYGNYWQR